MGGYKALLEQEYAYLREYVGHLQTFRADRQKADEANSVLLERVQSSRVKAHKTIERARVLCQEAREIRGVSATETRALDQSKNRSESGGETFVLHESSVQPHRTKVD